MRAAERPAFGFVNGNGEDALFFEESVFDGVTVMRIEVDVGDVREAAIEQCPYGKSRIVEIAETGHGR